MMTLKTIANRDLIRAGRTALTVVTACTVAFAYTAIPVFAASDLTKEETVYVVTDSTGAEEEIVVSDHLKNDMEADTIDDATNLSQVENVKGEETFSKGKGDQIVWKAEGNDIFYEGNSSETTPVTLDITYKLNGEDIKGADLEGKSGDVEIKIEYENNAKATVDGHEVTVPFIAMTGFIASDDTFSDITVDNGKVIDDGDKKIVVGMAAPGLAEALDIDLEKYDIDLSDSIRITGTAKKFDLQDMMTVVTNSVFTDIDTDEMNLDFDDEVNALNDGAKALMEGSDQLYQGISQLNDKTPELDNGMKTLSKGLNSLIPQMIDGTAKLRDGSYKVLGGMKEIKSGLDGDGTAENPGAINGLAQVERGLDSIKNGADNANTALKNEKTDADYVVTYLKGLKSVYDDLDYSQKQKIADIVGSGTVSGLDTAIQKAEAVDTVIGAVSGDSDDKALKIISNGASQAKGGVTKVKKGLQDASDALGSYDKKASEQKSLIGGQTEIYYGLSEMNTKLSDKSSQLSSGLKKMTTGTSALVAGTQKLDAGSLELSKGMSRFYKKVSGSWWISTRTISKVQSMVSET